MRQNADRTDYLRSILDNADKTKTLRRVVFRLRPFHYVWRLLFNQSIQ